MKKLFIISACLFGLFACQRMEEVPELKVVEFEASNVATDATRASYDSQKHALAWEYGDQVGCFADMSKNVKFTNSESSPNTFSGTVWAEPKEYYFYFPYSAAATAEGTVVTSTYPSAQELKVGTFGAAPVMVAKSSDLDNGVDFHNACGLVRFTVKSDRDRELVKVIFSANGGEKIAGKFTVDMASPTPSVSIKDGVSEITMTGNVAMTANREYSFMLALPPTIFGDGFTISVFDVAGASKTVEIDKGDLDLRRNSAVNFSDIIVFDTDPSTTVLKLTALSIPSTSSSPAITFTIDEDNQTAVASSAGFTSPTSLTLNLNYVATHDGRNITPTITLNSLGGLAGQNIDPSTKRATRVNLTMPRTITLAYGDEVKEYKVKYSQLSDTGLPVVYINTPGGAAITSKDNWMPTEPDKGVTLPDGDYTYIYIDADDRKSWDGEDFSDLIASKCYVKGRGNTTWQMDKKPYAIKLDSKSEVLGMPKHKRWVLLANKIDKSMIRNKLTFLIARACYDDGSGVQQGWNPSGHSVELVLNGVHKGNYLLCEQIKIDSKRINVAEADDPKTATSNQGYILEGDRYWGGDPTENLYWTSYRKETPYAQLKNGNFSYMYGTNYYDGGVQADNGNYKFKWGLKGPDDGDLGENGAGKETAAYKFINEKVTNVEKFIFNTMTTSTPLSTIAQHIHVDSFIDYWLVFEMAMNQEPNNPGSCYMYYDNKDGLLHAGPIWDFDWGTYNYNFNDANLYVNKSAHFITANSLWYCRLLQNTNIQARVIERWDIIKPKLQALLDEDNMKRLSDYMAKSGEYNWKIWSVVDSSHGDINGENSKTSTQAAEDVTTNARSRISDLDKLINNKRYY